MLFVSSVRSSEPSEDIPTRIRALNEHFTASIFTNVCRSLFERHRLMFSFLIAVRIMQAEGRINSTEWRYVPCYAVSPTVAIARADAARMSARRCRVDGTGSSCQGSPHSRSHGLRTPRQRGWTRRHGTSCTRWRACRRSRACSPSSRRPWSTTRRCSTRPWRTRFPCLQASAPSTRRCSGCASCGVCGQTRSCRQFRCAADDLFCLCVAASHRVVSRLLPCRV